MESFTGVKVISVNKSVIDKFYQDSSLSLDDFDGRLQLKDKQNMYIVLKDEVPKEQGGTASALCKVFEDKIVKLITDKNTSIEKICPRNKEQIFAFDALMNQEIEIIAMTGQAGTGKTLITIAAGIEQIEKGYYDKLILSGNMGQVGKNTLGFLPGGLDEKFLPFNEGFLSNLEYIMGGSRKKAESLIEHMDIRFLPSQLLRGASLANAFIVFDEVQNFTHHEALTAITRTGEGSKVIFLGDLMQRDVNLSKENTGLHKIINSPWTKKSIFSASLELIKCERSRVAELGAKIFEE